LLGQEVALNGERCGGRLAYLLVGLHQLHWVSYLGLEGLSEGRGLHHISHHLLVHLVVHLTVHLTVHLSIHLSIHLAIHQAINLAIHLVVHDLIVRLTTHHQLIHLTAHLASHLASHNIIALTVRVEGRLSLDLWLVERMGFVLEVAGDLLLGCRCEEVIHHIVVALLVTR